MTQANIDALIGPCDGGPLHRHLLNEFRSSQHPREIVLGGNPTSLDIGGELISWKGEWLIVHQITTLMNIEDEISRLIALTKSECAKLLVLSDDPRIEELLGRRMKVARATCMIPQQDGSAKIIAT